MPSKRSTQPAYNRHVSGQAYVRLAYKDFYLGPYGAPESYARYYSLLAEYNANGQLAPEGPTRLIDEAITIRHLVAEFRHRKMPRYTNNSGQYNRLVNLLKVLENQFGDLPAAEFGPLKLEAIRDRFVAKGNSRRYINEQVRCLISIFKFGVGREIVPVGVLIALDNLRPLRRGQAKESEPRAKVTIEDVRATIRELRPTPAAMIRIQVGTGCRPSELFRMTPAEIDRSGEVWWYRPREHKTAHHGKAKAIEIPSFVRSVFADLREDVSCGA